MPRLALKPKPGTVSDADRARYKGGGFQMSKAGSALTIFRVSRLTRRRV